MEPLVEVFLYWYSVHRDLHSFPTRRSSDLRRLIRRVAGERPAAAEEQARPAHSHGRARSSAGENGAHRGLNPPSSRPAVLATARARRLPPVVRKPPAGEASAHRTRFVHGHCNPGPADSRHAYETATPFGPNLTLLVARSATRNI